MTFRLTLPIWPMKGVYYLWTTIKMRNKEATPRNNGPRTHNFTYDPDIGNLLLSQEAEPIFFFQVKSDIP